MSLRVWLPLTKDLRNQGLDNVTVTNNGATFDANGKLGGCYSFDGSHYFQSNKKIGEGWKEITFACWVYLNEAVLTSGSWYRILGIGAHTRAHLDIASNNTLRLFVSQTGTTSGLGVYSTTIGQAGKWYHLCGVLGNNYMSIYINGLKESEKTIDSSSITYTNADYFRIGSITSGNAFNGKISDVRVYDHALSPMEVKQISQGLILHYPLNNNGFGQENLHKNSDTITSTWSINQGTVSNGIVTITPSSGSDRRIYQMPANGGWSWESNKTYTASIDARSPNGAILIFYPYGAGSMNKSYTVTSQWKRYSFTFTATQSGTASMTYHVNQTSGVTLQLKHPKLELGQKATPWCPNEIDKLYTILKLNDNIEYDCSGYQKNGEKISIDYSSDTPKYDVSSVFSASPSVIKIPNSYYAIQGSQNMTISVWAYKEDWSQYSQRIYSCTEGGGFNVQPTSSGQIEWAVNVYTDAEKTSHKYDTNLYIRIPKTNFSSGWHMFTWVYTTEGTSLYIDGVLEKTMIGTSYGLYFNPTAPLILGGEATAKEYTSPYLNGKLSDFRIYCTALSSEDIILLYNNSAYIDNQGNVYGAMYKEV